MKLYIYHLPDWPNFRWDVAQLAGPLAAVRHRQGRLIGRMQGLGFKLKQEAVLKTLTEDVLKTSEIEGERLDAEQVRSSIARHLGIDIGGLKAADRNVDGIVELMLDATGKFRDPLTTERLFAWHISLFPSGWSNMVKINAGVWRDDASGPMQVVSGPPGRETIHYQAPAAADLGRDMAVFLAWFNGPDRLDQVLKASLAHLWFVTIHPFADGNGRIARAVADMALARSDESSQRFYSMSTQIRQERKDYYEILEQTQIGTMDVTPWMTWFLACLDRAIEGAEAGLSSILEKSRFWESVAGIPLNERQRQMLGRLLDGFEGKLTNSKWAKLTKCSPDSALRDIQYLVEEGILIRGPEGGRSTSYALKDTVVMQ